MIDTNPNQRGCDLESLDKHAAGYPLVGDVLEFGTGSGYSAEVLCKMFPDKRVFTIDHYQGLGKTSKPLPVGPWYPEIYGGNRNMAEWAEGTWKFPIEMARDKLAPYSNAVIIVEDVHRLGEPSHYGIGKIAICNVDVDIYEPSVSSLEFLTKCVWDEVFIRFDDWHGGEPAHEVAPHERLALSEWLEKYRYEYEVTHGGYWGGVHVRRSGAKTPELRELAKKYGTDKYDADHFPDHGDLISYYQELLSDRPPESVRKVLEIGIGHPGCMNNMPNYKTGASLHMWEEYFPNADIFALDNKPEILINEGRICSFLCDQGSEESLRQTIPLLGQGFDFIEDDGSHNPNHQILTARLLVPLLAPWGIYAIEDITPACRDQVRNGIPYKSEFKEIIGTCGRLGDLVLVMRGEG